MATPRDWPQGLAFLKVELDLADTFAAIARDAVGSSKAERNRRNARAACDAVLRFMYRVRLSDRDLRKIRERLLLLETIAV